MIERFLVASETYRKAMANAWYVKVNIFLNEWSEMFPVKFINNIDG